MDALDKNYMQWFPAYEQMLLPKNGEIVTPDAWFYDHVWTDFDAQAVLQFLIDPRPSFPGHKEVVCAAWVGWLTDGTSTSWIRAMAVRAVADFMEKAEKRAMAEFDRYGIAAEIVARLMKMGPRFLGEIYYPIGGAKTLRRYRSDKTIARKSLLRLRKSIEEVRLLLQYFHSSILVDKNINQPSINDAKLIRDHIGISSGGKFSKIWTRYKSRAALIYAASLIPAGSHSLLEKIQRDDANWRSLRPYLADLASVAAGVNTTILSIIENGSTVATTLVEDNRATLPHDTVEQAVPEIAVVKRLVQHFTLQPLEVRQKK